MSGDTEGEGEEVLSMRQSGTMQDLLQTKTSNRRLLRVAKLLMNLKVGGSRPGAVILVI